MNNLQDYGITELEKYGYIDEYDDTRERAEWEHADDDWWER